MVKKSKLSILIERFGGIWMFNHKKSIWESNDGRIVYKWKEPCVCWMLPDIKCNCQPKYMMAPKDNPENRTEINFDLDESDK